MRPLTAAEVQMKEWAHSLNPKGPKGAIPGMVVPERVERTAKEETLIERGLRLLRSTTMDFPEDDIEMKRKRKLRAEQGIVTMGRL